MNEKLNNIFMWVEDELEKATKEFGSFNSEHEGYVIIKEEVDELWDAIKDKNSSMEEVRDEAIQVAAMAIRFIYDLEGED